MQRVPNRWNNAWQRHSAHPYHSSNMSSKGNLAPESLAWECRFRSKLKNGNCYFLFPEHWWVIKQRLKLSTAIYSSKRSQPDNVLRWRCWAKLVPSWWWLGNVVCTGWHLGRPNSMRHGERTIIHGDGSPMRALLIPCAHDFSTVSNRSNILSVPWSQLRFITRTISKSILQSDGEFLPRW